MLKNPQQSSSQPDQPQSSSSQPAQQLAGGGEVINIQNIFLSRWWRCK